MLSIKSVFYNHLIIWPKLKFYINFHTWRLFGGIDLRPKKKLLCCPHPTKIWKLGRSVDFFFFFFTYRERVEFSNIFFKVSKWGKLGRNAVKTHTLYTSAFLGHWIQILANSSPKSDIFNNNKKKKKKPTLFFRILRSVGRGQHNNFIFWPYAYDVTPSKKQKCAAAWGSIGLRVKAVVRNVSVEQAHTRQWLWPPTWRRDDVNAFFRFIVMQGHNSQIQRWHKYYPRFPELHSRRINSLIITALKYLTEHSRMEQIAILVFHKGILIHFPFFQTFPPILINYFLSRDTVSFLIPEVLSFYLKFPEK